MKRVVWIFLLPLLKYGVFGADEIKEVMEGGSLTLQTSFSEIQSDVQILWLYGKTVIARIHKANGIFQTHDDRAGGIFKEKLELNRQTGNLIIKDIKIKNSGDYQLDINSGATSTKFSVMVYARLPIPTIGFSECAPTPAGSSNPICVLQCSVQTVGLVTLSWYKGNNIVSTRVSDTCSSFSLRLEVDYDDKNTYSCMVNNPISNQTKDMEISGLCHTCAAVPDSGLSPGSVAGIVVGVLILAAAAGGIYCWYKISKRPNQMPLTLEVSRTEVMEGRDVSLKPATENKGAVMMWFFGNVELLTGIAEFNVETGKISKPGHVAGGRFKDRLELDKTTGSLTIRNTTTAHSGLYKVQIISSSGVSDQTFIVTVKDKVEEKVLKEVDEITLDPNTKIQKDDQILWMFEDNLIAQMKVGNGKTYDEANERFKDRLKLDEMTGSLTIKYVEFEHTGLYKLLIIISSGKVLYKKFNVSIQLKNVSVKEGKSATLNPDAKIQKNDQIQWLFGDEKSLIADIKGGEGKVYILEGCLTLDTRTGSLKISSIGAEQAGLYELKITHGNKTRREFFNVVLREKQVNESATVVMPLLDRKDLDGVNDQEGTSSL